MSMRRGVTIAAVLAVAGGLAGSANAAVVAASGYAVRTIPTPGTVQGGVARIGKTILVGQGAFGAGLEQIVRFEEGGAATTVATGFNSLGGVDVDAAGTLYVTDNGGDLSGAATGDTVFAFTNATTASGLAAAGHEVVPAGTIDFAQDVIVQSAGRLLVSDAAGPGAGRVVLVTGGTAMTFIPGLDYTAAIAITPTVEVLVGNVDASFAGAVGRYNAAGTVLGALASGLSGVYGVAVEAAGNALVSGGFTDDFSSSTIVAIPLGGGAPVERAHGFGFSSDVFYDAARDELLVLDFGVSAITAICRERDGDGVCDADDPCTFGSSATTKVAIGKLATPGGDDTLALGGEMTVPTSPAIDPLAHGARVVLSDANGVILDATLAPGAADPGGLGWKVKKTTWTWKGDGTLGGLTKVVLKTKADAPGLVKFSVKGKGGSYPTALAALPLVAIVSLDGSAGQCGEATFAGDACKYNAKKGGLRCK